MRKEVLSRKLPTISIFLLIAVTCAALSACMRSGQQQPQELAPPPIPTDMPPDYRPPQPSEVLEAIKRVYGPAVAVETGRSQYFLAGDLNGDSAPDLAVIVKPATGMLAEVNHELANWIRGDPQKVVAPDPRIQAHHARLLPVTNEPVIIGQNDVLLAIVHGYGPSGWRHPQARQSYLLKNAAGSSLELHTLDKAVKMPSRPPQLRGDVIRQTLGEEQGLLYYTGAYYAWHRFGSPRS